MPLEDSITLSRAQLVRLVQGLAGIAGYPNPDEPHEPGPWDPVIQNAFLNRVDLVLAGPQPVPWKSIDWAALNPQPLPPLSRWAQIAAGAILGDIRTRMALMQALPEEFHGPIVERIQMDLSRFADEVCGSEPWRWPGRSRTHGSRSTGPHSIRSPCRRVTCGHRSPPARSWAISGPEWP